MAKMRQELNKLKVNLEKEQEQCKNVMNQFAKEKSRQKVQFDRSIQNYFKCPNQILFIAVLITIPDGTFRIFQIISEFLVAFRLKSYFFLYNGPIL